jgi:hypothetical protein
MTVSVSDSPIRQDIVALRSVLSLLHFLDRFVVALQQRQQVSAVWVTDIHKNPRRTMPRYLCNDERLVFPLLTPILELTSENGFCFVRQQKRTQAKLSWAASLRKHFNVDPLPDGRGRAMRWVGWMNPATS